MMQTSNTFGERITCDMESSLNDQVKKRFVQELQIARRLSTEGEEGQPDLRDFS
jgi:hypothetical protein